MIRFENVTLKFRDRSVLENFCLQVRKGEKVRIAGRSGSGKSTFLKLILGFIKPDKGKIYFRDEPISHKNIWKIRQSMAYVSQEIRFGEGSVKDFLEDILSYKANQHLHITEAIIQEKLQQFYLNEKVYEQALNSLSGGEVQRIAIIAALLLDRDIYLLDEITSSLDPELKGIVAEYFMGLEHKTVLFISHDEVWGKYEHRSIKIEN